MILRFLPDNAMLLSGFSILFFLLLAPMGAAAAGLSNADSVYPLCLVTLAVVVWIFLTLKHISRDVFNFYSLFVTSAILFNAGQTLLEVFHLNAAGLLGDKFTSATLTSTLYLVVLCLVCFHTGGILGAAGGDRVAQEDDRPFLSAHALRMTGYLLLSISAIPALFTINHALEIVLRSGYFALYQQKQLAGVASGVEGAMKFVSGFFVPGLLFALAGHKNHRMPRIVLQFVIFVQVCTLMFLGYRGYSSMLLIAVLWMRHRLIRPLRLRWTLIGGIVLMVVVFPTVSAIRDIKGTSRLAGKVFVDAFLSIENPAGRDPDRNGRIHGNRGLYVAANPEGETLCLGIELCLGRNSDHPEPVLGCASLDQVREPRALADQVGGSGPLFRGRRHGLFLHCGGLCQRQFLAGSADYRIDRVYHGAPGALGCRRGKRWRRGGRGRLHRLHAAMGAGRCHHLHPPGLSLRLDAVLCLSGAQKTPDRGMR